MKSFLVSLVLLAISSKSFASGGYFSYEYGPLNITPDGGSSYGISSHRLSVYDTAGVLSAGFMGAMNKSAAESKKLTEMKKNSETLGTYSWNQPAPTPTDGELWSLILASDGNPIIDPISPEAGSTKKSMLGIEYTRGLWSYEAAPISFGAGFGLRAYLFSGGNSSDSAISVPINITASSQVYTNVIAYGDLAIGPIAAVQGKPFYLHYEAGLKWTFAESWQLSGTYRSTQDALSKNGPDGKPIKYSMTLANVGIGYIF